MKTRYLALLAGLLVACEGTPESGGEGAGGAGGSEIEPPFTVSLFRPKECNPTAAPPPFGVKSCDDGDPFTVDRCNAGHCAHSPAECDGFDAIEAQAVACDDDEPCSVDRCDMQHNLCLHDFSKCD